MIGAVCDAGPLTHLWQILLWPAFQLFHVLHIPEQVVHEVSENVPFDQLTEMTGCSIRVYPVDPARMPSKLSDATSFSSADLATLVLAREISPDFVLTDDLSLRRELESQQHNVMGSVGLVMYAYKHGLLTPETLDLAIEQLFVHSTLYLSPQFKAYVRKLIATYTSIQ